MPIAPQYGSPNVAPVRTRRDTGAALNALAARIAILEKQQWPTGGLVLPAYTNLGQAAQAGLTIKEIVQGGSGGGSGGGGGSTSNLAFGTTAVTAGAWNVAAPTFPVIIVAVPTWNTTIFIAGGNFNFGTSCPAGGGTIYWLTD